MEGGEKENIGFRAYLGETIDNALAARLKPVKSIVPLKRSSLLYKPFHTHLENRHLPHTGFGPAGVAGEIVD